jgi:hypothetical protein
VTLPFGKGDRFLPLHSLFSRGYHLGIGRSTEKRKVWAFPRFFVISCYFDVLHCRQQFLLEISSKHRPGVGWLRLQFLVIEESYAGARECSAGKKFSFGHFIPNSVWCFNIPMHSDVCRASTSNRVSVWVCRPESGTIIFF